MTTETLQLPSIPPDITKVTIAAGLSDDPIGQRRRHVAVTTNSDVQLFTAADPGVFFDQDTDALNLTAEDRLMVQLGAMLHAQGFKPTTPIRLQPDTEGSRVDFAR